VPSQEQNTFNEPWSTGDYFDSYNINWKNKKQTNKEDEAKRKVQLDQ